MRKHGDGFRIQRELGEELVHGRYDDPRQLLLAQVGTVNLVQVVIFIEKPQDIAPAFAQETGQPEFLADLVHLVVIVGAGGVEHIGLAVVRMDPLIILVGGDGGQRRIAYFIIPAQVAAVEGIIPGRRFVLVDGMDAFGFELSLRKTVEYGKPGGLGAGRRAFRHLAGKQLRAQTRRAQVKNAWPFPGCRIALVNAAVDQSAHGEFLACPEQLAAYIDYLRPAVFVTGKQVLLRTAVAEFRIE